MPSASTRRLARSTPTPSSSAEGKEGWGAGELSGQFCGPLMVMGFSLLSGEGQGAPPRRQVGSPEEEGPTVAPQLASLGSTQIHVPRSREAPLLLAGRFWKAGSWLGNVPAGDHGMGGWEGEAWRDPLVSSSLGGQTGCCNLKDRWRERSRARRLARHRIRAEPRLLGTMPTRPL